MSTLVCLVRYVIPALYAAMGMPVGTRERVALSAPIHWDTQLAGFITGAGDERRLGAALGCTVPDQWLRGFRRRWR